MTTIQSPVQYPRRHSALREATCSKPGCQLDLPFCPSARLHRMTQVRLPAPWLWWQRPLLMHRRRRLSQEAAGRPSFKSQGSPMLGRPRSTNDCPGQPKLLDSTGPSLSSDGFQVALNPPSTSTLQKSAAYVLPRGEFSIQQDTGLEAPQLMALV